MKHSHHNIPFKLFIVLAFATLLGCLPNTTTTSIEPTDDVQINEVTAEATASTGDEVLVVTGDFPPFSSSEMEGGGFVSEIVRAVFAEMGVPVRIEFYPWERAESMVASGEAWGAFPYTTTEERLASYDFTDTIVAGTNYFFYYGDAMQDVSFTELSDLQPYRIGGARGYWYLTPFEEAGLTVDVVDDDVTNLRKLHAGRIDLAPFEYANGYWLIESYFAEDAEQFGIISTPVGEINLNGVMVSRSYPNTQQLRTDFNAALARVIASGEYQNIVAKYGLDAAQLLQTP